MMDIKFSIQDLKRFGNYLLSKERKKNIPKQYQGEVQDSEISEYVMTFYEVNDDIIFIQNKN